MANSIANQLSPSQILGRAATLLRLLEEEGLPYDAWQIPIDDPAKRRSLVQYWRAGMPVCTVAVLRGAADVQAQSVHDARAVNELLSLGLTDEQLDAFWPPPDALPGYLTFFDPGWSLLRLRKFCEDKGEIFYSQDWYDREPFAWRTEEPRYRQIRLKAIDGSLNKNFDDQRRLLPETEEVLLVRSVTVAMVIHFLANGERLFDTCFVRCADRDSGGVRVYVGNFDSDGFNVSRYWVDFRHDSLGLASSVPPRKC